jgi:hypothetical protein
MNIAKHESKFTTKKFCSEIPIEAFSVDDKGEVHNENQSAHIAFSVHFDSGEAEEKSPKKILNNENERCIVIGNIKGIPRRDR